MAQILTGELDFHLPLEFLLAQLVRNRFHHLLCINNMAAECIQPK
jgi:hypothetical protein